MHRVGFLVLGIVMIAVAIAWFAVPQTDGSEAAAQAKAYSKAQQEYRAKVRLYRARGQWAKGANRACRTFTRRTNNMFKGATSRDEWLATVPAFRALYVTTLADIRSLRPVPRDRRQVRRMLASYNGALSSFDAVLEAVLRNDLPAARRALKDTRIRAGRGDRIASALGAQVCVNGTGRYEIDS
jgi:hypothetical protein